MLLFATPFNEVFPLYRRRGQWLGHLADPSSPAVSTAAVPVLFALGAVGLVRCTSSVIAGDRARSRIDLVATAARPLTRWDGGPM
ncbi:MAG TPA: hypothetical protein VK875_08800, partial [Euzebyales bacterium]|nr:hypothetical protein [Euzebyales bacterium]